MKKKRIEASALQGWRRLRRCGRVEMEALVAVQIALLTIYDMCKSADRAMTISDVRLLEKAGGRSGHWRREQGPVAAAAPGDERTSGDG